MTSLVTGASGFIGSHLVERIFQDGGEGVIGFDLVPPPDEIKNNHAYNHITGDVRDKELVKKTFERHPEIDHIYHLAAILGTSETFKVYSITDVVDVNIGGTLNFLESVRPDTKFTYISLPKVMGLNPYKVTKLTAEQLVQMYHEQKGYDTITCTVYNAYGPRQKWKPVQKIASTFIVNALTNSPITIYGDGSQSSDYVYVTDVADALFRAGHSRHNGTSIPIGCGKETSVNEFAELVKKLTVSQSKIHYTPMRMGEVPIHMHAALGLAKQYLGWNPTIELEEGLKKTVDWYNTQIHI